MGVCMNRKRSLLLRSVLVMVLSSHSMGYVELDDVKDKIDKAVETVRRCFNIPGLSLAIIADYNTLYTQGYGHTELKRKTNATSESVFCIGSITKSMSATLLAMLQDEGNFTFSSRLRDILGGDFRLMDSWRTERATLKDVLAHKMGVVLGTSDLAWMSDPFPRDQLVRRLEHFPVAADFRTKFIYNNFVYGLAAVVAEKIGRESWESLMEKKLFEPLEMKSATFTNTVKPPWKNWARPHVMTEGKLREISPEVHRGIGPIGSAASVCASAKDMAKYMHLHVNNGWDMNGNRWVDRKRMKELHAPEMALPNNDLMFEGFTRKPEFPVTETRETYALGWVVGSYRGHKTLMHGGVLFGYDALITLYPERHLGIYTGVNGPMGDPAQVGQLVLHQYIGDLLLGYTPWLNQSTLCSYPEPWKPREKYLDQKEQMYFRKTNKAFRPLTAYAGNYTSPALGSLIIDIIEEDNQKILLIKHGRIGRYKLYPAPEPDLFFVEAEGYLSFLTKLDDYAPTLMWVNVNFHFDGSDLKTPVKKVTLNFIEPGAETDFFKDQPDTVARSVFEKKRVIM